MSDDLVEPPIRELAGLLLRAGRELHFLPADLATRVVPMPAIARFPGVEGELAGMALVEGDIVPVFALSPSREAMVVCRWQGEAVGLVGGTVLSTGQFPLDDRDPRQVRVEHERARILDLGEWILRVQVQSWAGRWRG